MCAMSSWFNPAIQFASFAVSVVTLIYLVKYVGYTKKIAEQSMLQTEGSSKPAIIVIHTGTINQPPRLRNIGTGPALDVAWSVSGTKKAGTISYIEADKEADALSIDLQVLEHGAVMSGTNKVAIQCSYRSISGNTYSSTSD
jgi:hypothetical protein